MRSILRAIVGLSIASFIGSGAAWVRSLRTYDRIVLQTGKERADGSWGWRAYLIESSAGRISVGTGHRWYQDPENIRRGKSLIAGWPSTWTHSTRTAFL